MKRNFTLCETKQNEILLVLFFTKQAKYREMNFMFHFVSCFAKQKKEVKLETLN
jgi:hypothetical protein